MGRPELYHYTCEHGANGIRSSGMRVLPLAKLRPQVLGWLPPLAWFTSMAVPNRWALGLTQHLVSCDRTRHRFVVRDDPALVMRWARWTALHPEADAWRDLLETVPGVQPVVWWVAEESVKVVEDPSWTSR